MPHRRRPTGLLALLFLLVLPAAAAHAQGGDAAFTVRGIEVDVRADNAAQARDRAFAAGQYEAFQRLMARLVPEAARDQVPDLAVEDIVPMVRDVAVSDEKASSVRYIASLGVRFKGDAVREFLRGAGVPYAEGRDEPLLVLPVFIAEAGPVLWSDPNPWRDAWTRGSAGALVPIHAPLGELADLAAISADQALLMERTALEAIAARYGVADVLVATARLDDGTDGAAALVLDLSPFGPSVPRPVRRLTLPAEADEARENLMARGVETVAAAVDEAYKAGNVIAADRGGSLLVEAPLAGLESWLALRRRLDMVSLLDGYRVSSLSTQRAQMILDHVGEPADLIDALARRGLALVLADDGRWTLRADDTAAGLR